MQYKGIVFDLDHTLFDRYATMTAVGQQFYHTLKDYITPGLSVRQSISLWCDADKAKIHLGWETMLKYGEQIGLFTKAPDTKTYLEFLLPNFSKVAIPFPFTKPTLEKLKTRGYLLGLITNGRPEIQWAKIKLLDLENAFDQILIPSEIGMQKPDPGPFLEMAKRLGVSPSKLLYVGDNPINDVEASRNAGFVPVWVKTTGVWEDYIERAKWEIDTVAELPQILEKMNG